MILLRQKGDFVGISDDPKAYEPALRAFRSRLPVTDHEFKQLTEDKQRHAFKVAGVQQADLVLDVWNAIDRAIEKGTLFDDFQKDVGEKLANAWGKADSVRLRTVYDTNLQTAYSHGRWEQMTAAPMLRARPYFEFRAVLDGRTTEVCKAANWTLLPADDDYWINHYPPLHHRCRSYVQNLTREDGEDKGTQLNPNQIEPAEGFGKAPVSDEKWEPDLERYSEPIAEVLRGRLL